MILYIETDFEIVGSIETDDEFDDSILKQFAVQHTITHLSDDLMKIYIPSQKVTLDEISMNTLFDTIIELTDYTMSYGSYGGVGCEFSIRIRAK